MNKKIKNVNKNKRIVGNKTNDVFILNYKLDYVWIAVSEWSAGLLKAICEDF